MGTRGTTAAAVKIQYADACWLLNSVGEPIRLFARSPKAVELIQPTKNRDKN